MHSEPNDPKNWRSGFITELPLVEFEIVSSLDLPRLGLDES